MVMLLQSLIITYQEKYPIPSLVSLIFSGYGQDEKKICWYIDGGGMKEVASSNDAGRKET